MKIQEMVLQSELIMEQKDFYTECLRPSLVGPDECHDQSPSPMHFGEGL
jgi:hypothetical protein